MTQSVIILGGYNGANTPVPVTGGGGGGSTQVEGRAADGSAVTGNPVLMGGSDGTNVQNILVDTAGRVQVVGAAANGAAVSGNPVLVAGQNGSGNVTYLQLDAASRLSTAVGSWMGVTGLIGQDPTNGVGSTSIPVALPRQMSFDIPNIAQLSSAAINFASSGDNVVVAAVGGQRVRVFRMFFVVAAATTITIKDAAAGTALTGAMTMSAGGALVFDLDAAMYRESWFTTALGGAFVINSSVAVQVSGRVYYVQT